MLFLLPRLAPGAMEDSARTDSDTARPERSDAKSKGAQSDCFPHFIEEPYSIEIVTVALIDGDNRSKVHKVSQIV